MTGKSSASTMGYVFPVRVVSIARRLDCEDYYEVLVVETDLFEEDNP